MSTTNRTHFFLVLDDSASMRAIARAAHAQFNQRLVSFANAAKADPTHDIRVSLYFFGARVKREFHDVPAQHLSELKSYEPNQGATHLYEAYTQALRDAQELAAKDRDTAFCFIALTDGQDNSGHSVIRFRDALATAQSTGRYTLGFLLPPGERRAFAAQSGVPLGNVSEWEQTEAGVERSGQVQDQGIKEYLVIRAAGAKSTKSLFPDLSEVKPEDLKKVLVDVQAKCQIFTVGADAPPRGVEIQPFMIEKMKFYQPGTCFYELSDKRKAGNKVQNYKAVLIRDRASGAIYTGDAARQLLGLPATGQATLRPGDHGQYQIYVQSMSNNRVLQAGTGVIYYPEAMR